LAFFTYIMASQRNGTLYIGMTEDVYERVRSHRAKDLPGFTAKYGVTRLVYREAHDSREAAFRRERAMKKWNRAWKLELIERFNPTWRDLFEDFETKGAMDLDLDYMRRAIALAVPNVGRTADNPSVGCVIVAGGVVVGEGATAEGGRPHAEEQALAMAGDRAAGATAYVTLEPCGARSRGGRSCSELLAAAGVARVVVACEDASPFASGQGAERLTANGIPVESGFLADEAAAALRY
jgi:pyrimidine deaminase RibD-like protein/predicted GIY-YIG superfamily endonuclease